MEEEENIDFLKQIVCYLRISWIFQLLSLHFVLAFLKNHCLSSSIIYGSQAVTVSRSYKDLCLQFHYLISSPGSN